MNTPSKVVAPGRTVKVQGMGRCGPGTPLDGLLSEQEILSLQKDGWVIDAFPAAQATPAAAPARTSGKVGESPDPWGLDPDGLRGRTLEELNLLIIERDQSMPPAASVDAAIALLSRDYVPPQG